MVSARKQELTSRGTSWRIDMEENQSNCIVCGKPATSTYEEQPTCGSLEYEYLVQVAHDFASDHDGSGT